MSAQVRIVPMGVKTSVEMFSDVIICRGDECRVVQVMNRWWVYEDGSYVLTLHSVEDPMSGSSHSGCDACAGQILEARTEAIWDLTV